MPDLHVEALYYRVQHSPAVDYDQAEPMQHEEPNFLVNIEKGAVTVVMKSHHETAEAARAEVEPFLRAWELADALDYTPGMFELVYERAAVIDRDPKHGPRGAIGFAFVSFSANAVGHAKRGKYPDPPNGIALNPDVDLMLAAYRQYREGRRTLADAAYFCLTVLQHRVGSRGDTARHYAVEKKVLDRIAELATKRGGAEARKADGANTPFTPTERQWLEGTMKRLLRRAAEVAHDPATVRPQITE